ncbi:hypothetical protein B4168_1806 [Anoxybacillus flavithermus]|nr:hypothetical protein B4168_1806 [Anoxybacillus flavithermus]OAO83861.1 hypothetical protein GT23_3996 [Parageobacillus thermoglucosidasius]
MFFAFFHREIHSIIEQQIHIIIIKMCLMDKKFLSSRLSRTS